MPIQTALDSISQSAGSPYGFKNRIINGDMRINQRAYSGSPSNSNYTLDRYFYNANASRITISQSTDAPDGFTNSVLVTSSAAASIGVSDYTGLCQIIEGYNIADLAWGTASAKTVTLSFWVKSSLTGTFGGSLRSAGGGAGYYGYSYTYTINNANTWEYKTVTIAGPTSSSYTWSNNNTQGIYVWWDFGTGTTYTTTAGTWTNQNLVGASGTTKLVATNGATWQMTGAQLEKGSTATAFDYRPYGTEWILCWRYYQRWLANATNAGFGTGRGDGSSAPLCVITYPVAMRSSPTIGQSNTMINTPTSYTVSGISSSSMGTNGAIVTLSMAAGTVTAGYACVWIAVASTSYIELIAEL